jgi:hypothetical protein
MRIFLWLKESRPRFAHRRKLPYFITFIYPNRHCVAGSFCIAAGRFFSCEVQAIHSARRLLASL